MTNYNCKYQMYKNTGIFAKNECDKCTCDPVNNPRCQSYEPVNIKDFMQMKGRFLKAINSLEKRV